jgi:hypothetical protein
MYSEKDMILKEQTDIVKFHARLICDAQKKKDFSTSSAVILVSVGQRPHETEKFESTINIINNTFKSCAIAVCDSLQRHSLQLGTYYSDEEMYDISNQLGLEWISRNQHYIDRLTIPYTIFRWDDWLKRPDYLIYRQKIMDIYHSDPDFANAMHSTITNFVTRFQKRQKNKLDEEIIKKASFNYLVEECAIIMIMWQEKNYDFIVYPSESLEVMAATHAKFVLDEGLNLLNWVVIKLKKKIIKSLEEITEA